MLAPERMSDLVGMIYDCAIEPDRWPGAIAEICRTIGCRSGMILLIDLHRSQHRLAYAWGMSAEWEKRFLDYSGSLTGFYGRAFSRGMCIDGESLVLSPVVDAAGPRAQTIYGELTKPHGISEMVQTVVLRQAGRLAVFGANRHGNVGPLTNADRSLMRLLVPHIRRAVSISDILDVKKLEAHALAATLDKYASSVVVVAHQARILHANDAAKSMFSAAGPIAATNGFLKARDLRANDELMHAIDLAQRDEASIGAAGIGVALKSATGEPCIAHVLPLAKGDLRTRLMPPAIAAVFVAQPCSEPMVDISTIANSFELTPAEARTLACLVNGKTIAETAEGLDISVNTVKTHLAHIFSKTGTSRQADLVALVNQLTPRVRRPATH
jgi:DNA-binding CsgD family transcriptional regulator